MDAKKVILFGRDSNAIRPLVEQSGFLITDINPDFVISYGGDGTLMESEFMFPGIPKIILKGSLICKKASHFQNDVVLQKIQNGAYKIESIEKLVAYAGNESLIALNDITVHNTDPRHAIRYVVCVNGKQIGKEIIGDGVVVATPFGSTGYYRSITDSFFEVGIGLAFNNSTEQSDHMVLKENSVISFRIMRGPAVIYADNQEKSFIVREGDSLEIKNSGIFAKILEPVD